MRSAVVVLVLGVLVAPAGAPARSDAGRLAVTDRSPLTVRGVLFRPRERVAVRVVVRGEATATKSVAAGARGTWVARFTAVDVGLCGSFVVRATGSLGSTARYVEHQPPCGAAP